MVKQNLGELFIRNEAKIPSFNSKLITVTEVRMTPDLKTARVYVIPLGGVETKETVRILTENSHLVRKALSKRLDIKFLPKLTFVEDNSFEYAEKIEKIIKKNKENDKEKKDTIKTLAIHDKDVGSTEVQIGLLTDKIIKLSEHFKKFKKDKHSTLGLTKSVNKRKKLLTYLKKKNVLSYQKVIKTIKFKEIMFEIHKEELEVNGKKLSLETGKVARQADGAIIATLGETVVIATAVGAKKLMMDKTIFHYQ